jgi:hypothetical protein
MLTRSKALALAGAVVAMIGSAMTVGAVRAQDNLAPVKAGGPGDYLVTVGKRTLWKSQADAEMRRFRARMGQDKAPPIIATRLTPVTVGKQTQVVDNTRPGSVRIAVSDELPEDRGKPRKVESKGRYVTQGKWTYWVPFDK